jgi:hypothetical protein
MDGGVIYKGGEGDNGANLGGSRRESGGYIRGKGKDVGADGVPPPPRCIIMEGVERKDEKEQRSDMSNRTQYEMRYLRCR